MENDNKDLREAICFIDYNKIQDNLIYLAKGVSLKFNLVIRRRDKNGQWISNLAEYGYHTQSDDKLQFVIKRNMNFFYSIEFKGNYINNIQIFTKDIEPFKVLIDNSIMPWFVGTNRIFDKVKDKLVINGKYTKAVFPLSDAKYIIFYPIIIEYEDNKSIEGLRMEINSPDNYVDISLSKFMELVYYIKNVDMYSAACGMLSYMKTPPYLENYTEISDDNDNFTGMPRPQNNNYNNTPHKKSYFDNL